MPVSKRRKKPKARAREPRPLTIDEQRRARLVGSTWLPASRAVVAAQRPPEAKP